MHTLIMTVGLPRSGKSTWAREYAAQHNTPVVNPDSIRLALHGQAFVASAEPMVWAVAHLMVSSLFKAGHATVILDATNITEHRRKDWRSREWMCHYVCFTAPRDECIRRARAQGQEELVPIIERMASSLEWPEPSTFDGQHDTTFMHWVEPEGFLTEAKMDETEADRQRAEERRLLTTAPVRSDLGSFMRRVPRR